MREGVRFSWFVLRHTFLFTNDEKRMTNYPALIEQPLLHRVLFKFLFDGLLRFHRLGTHDPTGEELSELLAYGGVGIVAFRG